MSKKLSTEINQIELYFEWWLNEMIQYGYVKKFVREPETLTVKQPEEYGRILRFKTKDKEIESFNLFPKVEYTYDYIVYWNSTAEYLFFEEVLVSNVFQFGKPVFIAHTIGEDVISYVDVKPTNSVQRAGGKVSSAITFPLKQRMLWDSQRLFINKVVPIPMSGTGYSSALFIKTFTPERYLITDGGRQARLIKYKIVSIKQYVNGKTSFINNLLTNTK